VINLTSDDAEANERSMAERAGMRYLQIPMTTHEPPTSAQLAQFLKIVNDPGESAGLRPLRGGRHRTGVMTAEYRMTEDGWNADQAFQGNEAVQVRGRLPSLRVQGVRLRLPPSGWPVRRQSRRSVVATKTGFLTLDRRERRDRKEKPCCGRATSAAIATLKRLTPPQPCLKFTQVFNIFTSRVQFEDNAIRSQNGKVVCMSRVLIADDEDAIRRWLARSLGESGPRS